MMKQRRIYYRKKGKSLILEGRLANGKPLLIWTLPDAEKLISQIVDNASFLPQEKREQINEKYMRLDFQPDKKENSSPKLRTAKIKRTEENDA